MNFDLNAPNNRAQGTCEYTEITQLFLQNTIEISELQELADALLIHCLLSVGDAKNWYEFVHKLVARVKKCGASVLVHAHHIGEISADTAFITVLEHQEDARMSDLVKPKSKRAYKETIIYPEPIAIGVSADTWWYI